jgi:1,4-dihydroxy-2-naphthoate octaprenyltransferase
MDIFSIIPIVQATRPKAFVTSVISVVLPAIYILNATKSSSAFTDFNPNIFLLTVLLVLLAVTVHALANTINTFFDFQSNRDQKSTAIDRTLVDKLIPIQTLQYIAFGCIVIALGLSRAIFHVHQWTDASPDEEPSSVTYVADPLFIISLFVAVIYSSPPFPLKCYYLSEVAICALQGPILQVFVLRTLTNGQTIRDLGLEERSLQAFLVELNFLLPVVIPLSFLIGAIQLIKNMRKNKMIKTIDDGEDEELKKTK